METCSQYCRDGVDRGFYKPEDSLVPFTADPYYAGCGFMATDGVFGGIKVNADMQACRKDGGLVEGLYATGDFASGRHVIVGGTVKRRFINDMN